MELCGSAQHGLVQTGVVRFCMMLVLPFGYSFTMFCLSYEWRLLVLKIPRESQFWKKLKNILSTSKHDNFIGTLSYRPGIIVAIIPPLNQETNNTVNNQKNSNLYKTNHLHKDPIIPSNLSSPVKNSNPMNARACATARQTREARARKKKTKRGR